MKRSKLKQLTVLKLSTGQMIHLLGGGEQSKVTMFDEEGYELAANG
ncbi:MAG: hypothetical protein AAFQ94_01025 [Bacteroidota bacterium]